MNTSCNRDNRDNGDLYFMLSPERFLSATRGFDLKTVGRAVRAMSLDLEEMGSVPNGPPPSLKGRARLCYMQILEALGEAGIGRDTP